MANRTGTQGIDIATLPLPQLSQISQQLDGELEMFQQSMAQLKMVQNKYQESQDCLTKLTPENTKQDILVPLTTSMYVPGRMCDTDHVLVDIGTGYYAEKNVPGAQAYFKRKVEYVGKQIEKIQPILQEKYKMKQAVVEVLQMKVQAQMAS